MVKETGNEKITDEETVIVDVDDGPDSLAFESVPGTSSLLKEEEVKPKRMNNSSKQQKRSPIIIPEERNTEEDFESGIKDDDGTEEGNAFLPHDSECLATSMRLPNVRTSSELNSRSNYSRTLKRSRVQWQYLEKPKDEIHQNVFEEVPFPDWKSVGKKYREIERRRMRLNNEDQWLSKEAVRVEKGTSIKESEETDIAASSSAIPVFSARSKRLTLSSIVVPEEDVQFVRVYRFNSRSRDGRTMYYRCSKCDTLCNNDKKAGVVRKNVFRASLKTINGRIAGDAHPKHHPDCKPISNQLLKAQEIDKNCRVRVKEGVLTPKQAWSMGRQMAMEQSVREEEDINTVPFPDWKKLRRKYSEISRSKKQFLEQDEEIVYDDDINVGLMESVPMQSNATDVVAEELHPCSCRQYYEANVQIHENIVNYLEEMRAIRDEIRQVFDESRRFVIEEPIYQVIEEAP